MTEIPADAANFDVQTKTGGIGSRTPDDIQADRGVCSRHADREPASGQLPLVHGSIERTGKVGSDVSVEEASRAAEVCHLNALSASDALAGMDSVLRVVKVVGFVASAVDFAAQPDVVNGASNLLAGQSSAVQERTLAPLSGWRNCH
jgi:hypothetical protein